MAYFNLRVLQLTAPKVIIARDGLTDDDTVQTWFEISTGGMFIV